jgi:hypothetical protein
MTIKGFKIWTTLFVLLCIVFGFFPFFWFKCFETHTALVIATKYVLPLIVIGTVPSVTLLYFRRLKRLNAGHTFKSVQHEKLADFFNCFLLILLTTASLFGASYSTIITTNAFLGHPETVYISETVLDYYTARSSKSFRHRRYIKFHSPLDGTEIEMQVYKEYSVGDRFEKEMKVGKWNILYSKD